MLGRFFLGAEHDQHVLAGLDAAAVDLADADAADVGRVIEGGDLQLQRRVDIGIRCRDMLEHGVEQGLHVFARLVEFHRRPAVEAGGIDDREIELLVGGAQLVEQVEGQVDRIVGIGSIAVDLVDQHDRAQAKRQRLLGNETGLRHRAFGSIDQQHHAIDHAEHALDLAAEIGVARGVDNVDMHAFVFDRGVLGKNRDAAFLFQVVGVHDALDQLLVCGEGAGLAEKLVDQGGFTVVNVSDDGDVANRTSGHGEGLKNQRRDSTTRAAMQHPFLADFAIYSAQTGAGMQQLRRRNFGIDRTATSIHTSQTFAFPILWEPARCV